MKLDQSWGDRFAREWVNAWNDRVLSRVLDHYTDEFEMSSPFIAELAGEPSGTLTGKSAIEAYWRSALTRMPDLRFELLRVLVGAGSIVLYYKTSFGKLAAEVIFINPEGKVTRAFAHYMDDVQSIGEKEHKLDHIDLRVRRLDEAKSFYDQVMPVIGFPKSYATSLGIAYEVESNHPKPEFVGLIEDPDHRPSATRIAFRAPDKATVDRVAEVARLAGARNTEGPMACPEYSPTYYAFFFDDPSGNHLEVCCRTSP